jgi:L-gulonolactone oxidase
MTKKNEGVWTSWNENITHTFQDLYTVHNENELQEIVAQSEKVRFFGSKQSSSDISAGVGTLIDMRSYDKLISYDDAKRSITVESGMLLADLIATIESNGWCIPCLPDINTVTIGGALATGTHGTSGSLLATYVSEFRVVLADGSVKVVKEGDALMEAMRVSIGVLGVFSTITFQCEPLYTLHLKEGPQNDAKWMHQLKEKVEKHAFYRVLWLPHTGKGYVITGEKIPANAEVVENNGPGYLKHRRTASKFLYKYTHKFPWFTSVANNLLYWAFFSSKKESKGSLYEATVTKSRGSTLELAEWTVALDVFPQVFEELKTEINKWSNASFIHIPMDVRFVSKDNSWLSYAYKQDTVTMGCVSRNAETADAYEAFQTIEKIFLKYGGRPHWGKRFAAKNEEMSKLYPKWEAFKTIRKELDPSNKFLNPYLSSLFDEK